MSERIYRLLLLAYPADFRREFGDDMTQVFRTRARTAGAFAQRARFWRRTLTDWIASAARERIASLTPYGIMLVLVALGFGLFAAYVDFNNDEVQAPVLVVLVASFILGVAQPRQAWRWPLIVALCLPLTREIAPLFGLYPKLPATPNNFATLLALIPAFIGAYSGVAVRLFGRAILD